VTPFRKPLGGTPVDAGTGPLVVVFGTALVRPPAPAASCAKVRFMIRLVYSRVCGLIEARIDAVVGPLCAIGRAYPVPSAPPASSAGVRDMIDGTFRASCAVDVAEPGPATTLK
jgi:hypothetical protein